MLGQPKDRIPFSFTDIGKIAVGLAGVGVAFIAVREIQRLVNFVVGRQEEIPFEPNDVLFLRMRSKGRFPRTKRREWVFFREVITKLYNNKYERMIPFTSFFVARRTGATTFDWRCRNEDPEFFCNEVVIKIPLEFPAGIGRTRKRKETLLAIAKTRAIEVFGSQMKDFEVGLRSLGGVKDFDQESGDVVAGLEARFR